MFDEDNNRIINRDELPGYINTYFAEIGKKMSLRLKSFLRRNSILTDHQHGFRPGRSTISATTDFINDVYSSFNDRKPVHAMFLDFKKAFDSVSHNLLLLKLREIGLCAHFYCILNCN